MSSVEIGGRRVRLTSLDRVLYAAAGFTKADLVQYYAAVAPVIVPHLGGRPVTLRRFPEGIDESGWYQHECPPGAPAWVRTRVVTWPSGRAWTFCAVEDPATLVWLANLGTIELHPFFVLAERPDEPTAVIFDLDPGPPAGVPECCAVALRLRALLDALGLDVYAKVSGALGLHLVVPLNSPHTWAETKAFARAVAGLLVEEEPELVVDRQRRDLRAGKVLVDWLQNDPTRSTVASYSLRVYGWPTVSAPVRWEEVEAAAAGEALVLGPAAVVERLERDGDLHAPVLELEQRLPVL